MNGADTAWVLVSTALVLLMTPALALFYGGLVRGKNVLSTFMHSFFSLGLITVQWAVIGYSLAFAPSIGGLVGGLDHVFLSGVGTTPRPDLMSGVPHLVFCCFQLMFAIITPALISGAYAERLKFSAYTVYSLAWTTLVYDPLAHWVWHPDGWLFQRGALDFAGGTVVHASSGISALIFAYVLGPRHGYPRQKMLPHNLTMCLTGAGLLWFGWFGFNAGSAGGANGIAALALANTHLAAGAGALAWSLFEWWHVKKPTALGVASGLVAGLVVITPAAGFCSPMSALSLGLIGGVVCYFGITLKHRFGYDDALDAFGIHGIGGMLGAVLTGVVASQSWNPDIAGNGLMFGEVALFVENIIGLVAAVVYAGVVSYFLLVFIDRTIGLRAEPEVEQEGLDITMHGEEAYSTAGVMMKAEVAAPERPEQADDSP